MPDEPQSARPRELHWLNYRKTDRVSIAIRVLVSGKDPEGRAFSVEGRTVTIGRFGAQVVLPRRLGEGDLLAVRRVGIETEVHAEVVEEVSCFEELFCYGVEILDPDVDIWGIYFPSATESEVAAARAVLECIRCHAREVAYLSQAEVKMFEERREVSRLCRRCNEATVWVPAALSDLVAPSPTPSGAERSPIEPSGGAPSTIATPQRTRHIEKRLDTRIVGCVKTAEHGEEALAVEDVSEKGAKFRSVNQYAQGTLIELAVPYVEGGANVFVPATVTSAQLEAGSTTGVYRAMYLRAHRKAKRVAPKGTVHIGFIGSGVRTTGEVIDLSMTGVLVRTPELIKAGSMVRMGLEMGVDTVRIAAVARRKLPGVGTAFEFLNMSSRDRLLLRRLILRLEMGSEK